MLTKSWVALLFIVDLMCQHKENVPTEYVHMMVLMLLPPAEMLLVLYFLKKKKKYYWFYTVYFCLFCCFIIYIWPRWACEAMCHASTWIMPLQILSLITLLWTSIKCEWIAESGKMGLVKRIFLTVETMLWRFTINFYSNLLLDLYWSMLFKNIKKLLCDPERCSVMSNQCSYVIF